MRRWTPIDRYLPAALHCGKDRTLQGVILIFTGASLLCVLQYSLFLPGIGTQWALMSTGGTAFLEFRSVILLLTVVIIFSIVGDLFSHALHSRIKSPILKEIIRAALFHTDNYLGAICGLFIYCWVIGTWPVASILDWTLSIIIYGFCHFAIDSMVHWNPIIGLKSFKQDILRKTP